LHKIGCLLLVVICQYLKNFHYDQLMDAMRDFVGNGAKEEIFIDLFSW
jgi:hypothetical protein